MKWDKLVTNNRTQIILRQKNRPENECIDVGHVCHSECSSDGCWGPKANECLSCTNYQLGDTCVANCDSELGIYDAGKKICKNCDSECKHTCSGPGPGNCTECRHVKDGPYCVAKCPNLKFNASGLCEPCHENCVEGCTGPNNTVGPGGCTICERAVVVGHHKPYAVKHCIRKDEECPEGYFLDYVSPQEQGNLKALIGKSFCRQCHPRCKACTNYGFHISVCLKCAAFKLNEQCEDSCPSEYFPDKENKTCIPCAEGCRECYGPETTQCKSCRNFKIVINNNLSKFNCVATCPPEKPYVYFYPGSPEPACVETVPVDASSTGIKSDVENNIWKFMNEIVQFVGL